MGTGEDMDITKSLCCRRLCLASALSCPHCGKGFPPGSLAAKADAENTAFTRRTYTIFVAAFLFLPPALFLILGYLHGLH
jgi:hypothetical protein